MTKDILKEETWKEIFSLLIPSKIWENVRIQPSGRTYRLSSNWTDIALEEIQKRCGCLIAFLGYNYCFVKTRKNGNQICNIPRQVHSDKLQTI